METEDGVFIGVIVDRLCVHYLVRYSFLVSNGDRDEFNIFRFEPGQKEEYIGGIVLQIKPSLGAVIDYSWESRFWEKIDHYRPQWFIDAMHQLERNNAPTGRLHYNPGMFIRPEFLRRGLGAALLKMVFKQSLFRDNDVSRFIFAHCTSEGKGLYTKLGFQRLDEETFIYEMPDSHSSSPLINSGGRQRQEFIPLAELIDYFSSRAAVVLRSFDKDIVFVPTGMGRIELNLVDPLQPPFDFMFRFDEFLKVIERTWQRIVALWFEPYYYWLWEKMTRKIKIARDWIIVNLRKLLDAVRAAEGEENIRRDTLGLRSSISSGQASDERSFDFAQDFLRSRTTKDQTETTNLPVGAVVQVSSSPFGDLTDDTWLNFWEGKLAKNDAASEKLAGDLAQRALKEGPDGVQFLQIVKQKLVDNPNSAFKKVGEKIEKMRAGAEVVLK